MPYTADFPQSSDVEIHHTNDGNYTVPSGVWKFFVNCGTENNDNDELTVDGNDVVVTTDGHTARAQRDTQVFIWEGGMTIGANVGDFGLTGYKIDGRMANSAVNVWLGANESVTVPSDECWILWAYSGANNNTDLALDGTRHMNGQSGHSDNVNVNGRRLAVPAGTIIEEVGGDDGWHLSGVVVKD